MSGRPDKPAQYTGHLARGPDDAAGNATIVGQLADQFGWTIDITGTRDPSGGYVLEGRLGATPSAYKIPAIDGDAQ